MRRKIFNKKGMTLIEALIALAISVIGLTAFLTVAFKNRSHKTAIDHSVLMKEILTNNVIEVRAMALTDLPAATHCLVRTYSSFGDYQKEDRVSGDPQKLCDLEPPKIGIIQIIWSSSPLNADEIELDSEGIKVPTDINLLRKVTVSVRAVNRGENNQLIERHMTVYKR